MTTREQATTRFFEVFASDVDMPGEIAPLMSCDAIDALTALMEAHGFFNLAAYWRGGHADSADDPQCRHQDAPEDSCEPE